MRFLAKFTCLGFIVAALSAGVEAQSPVINGPVLGFTSDSAGAGIRPVFGIPGASALGDPFQFDAGIRGAVISPKQDYAIASRADDAQIVFIDLTAAVPAMAAVSGTRPASGIAVVSPTGSVAAVYDAGSRTVQVIGRLPNLPQLIQEFDASRIPGSGRLIAVSDDGSMALVKFAEAETVSMWVMDSSGASSRIALDRPSAAAFFPNRLDAIVTDDAAQTAFLIMDAARTAIQTPLISAADGVAGFSIVSTSEDGRRVFFADAASGAVAIVDMETRQPVLISCQCRPTGLYRLKGTSIFRLAEPSSEPMMGLDASSPEPRIVVIAPYAVAAAAR